MRTGTHLLNKKEYKKMMRIANLYNCKVDPFPMYPPTNFLKESNNYLLEMALAGFKKSEIEVLDDSSKLVIRGKKEESDESVRYIHKGISSKSFEVSFTKYDYIGKVIEAKFEDGMLKVYLSSTRTPQETVTIK